MTYPDLRHVRYGALWPAPNAPSQYDCCNFRLHTDFDRVSTDRPVIDRPITIIVSLDPFNHVHLLSPSDPDSEMVERLIHPGETTVLSGSCFHAGAANNRDYECFRLFAFLATNIQIFSSQPNFTSRSPPSLCKAVWRKSTLIMSLQDPLAKDLVFGPPGFTKNLVKRELV